ncbi:unnamed protein product, partial [Amoebophrya sp. A25]|eukprot:GSA25T00024947001.1
MKVGTSGEELESSRMLEKDGNIASSTRRTHPEAQANGPPQMDYIPSFITGAEGSRRKRFKSHGWNSSLDAEVEALLAVEDAAEQLREVYMSQ